MKVNEIAPPKADAWKPKIGDTITGTIIFEGSRTGANFAGDKTEEKMRIVLDTGDGEITIWATTNTDVNGGGWAKRDAEAIAAAVRAAGQEELLPGGTLTMTRIDDVPTERGKAKAYTAEYQPPEDLPATVAGLT